MPNRVLNVAEMCTSGWCLEAVQGNDHIVYLVCTSALPSHLLSSKGLWKLTCNPCSIKATLMITHIKY